MTPGDLHRAILADPDDVSLRLAYADALPSDDPRGEFIRVQVALAGLDEGDARRPALRKREADLLELHGAAWAGLRAKREYERFGPILGDHDQWEFGRGFLESGFFVAARDFVERPDAVFAL